MALLAVFGITSDGLNLVVNLLLLFLVVFWLALVYWTFADARRRIEDPMVVGCATAASLFPFAGTIVYMIVRPPEYLEDVRERELEIAAAEVRLAAVEHLSCSYCNFEIERSFLRCPSCLRRLKEPCTTCGKPLAPTWKICPYCESEIGQAPPQPRRRARPAAAAPTSGGQRPVATSRGQRAAAPSGGQRAAVPSGEQRRAAASEGPRQSAGSEADRRAAPSERQRAAPAGQRNAAPEGQSAAPGSQPVGSEGQRQPASGARGGGQRAASSAQRRPRPVTPATDAQGKRPPVEAPSERSPAGDRKKRSGTPAGKRQGSEPAADAVTAEQPAARPRTRPPSAG